MEVTKCSVILLILLLNYPYVPRQSFGATLVEISGSHSLYIKSKHGACGKF